MTHLDLFSGIGGFAYAVDQVWEDVEHIFCDNELFARQVLNKHWPEAYIYDDIRSITTNSFNKGLERKFGEKETGQRGQRSGIRPRQEPFILTGGFPCQPFSAAGVRRGTNDERYLWPEMLRVIRLTQPKWVIAENVGGLLTWEEGLVFKQVCSDLEASGYEVQAFVIPAVSVNAPHRRDRVWFVANSVNGRSRGTERGSLGKEDSVSQEHRTQDSPSGEFERTDSIGSYNQPSANTKGKLNKRGVGLERKPDKENSQLSQPSSSHEWNKDWMEVATQFCSVDDGLPVELDGFKLSKSKHRAEQIKAYGNAIVPQVAVEILKGIKLYDSPTTKAI